MKGDSLLEHIKRRQKELRADPLPYFRLRIQDMFLEDFGSLMNAYIDCANSSPWTSEDTIFLFEYYIQKEPQLICEIIESEYDELYHLNGTPFSSKEYVKWLQIIAEYYKVILDSPASYIGNGNLVQQGLMNSFYKELDWAI